MAQKPRDVDPTASAMAFLGAELRRCRLQRQWSLEHAAGLIPCSKGHLGLVETGERFPDESFARLCDQLYQTDGLVARLWRLADAERTRDREARKREELRTALTVQAVLAPATTGDVVYMPVLAADGTVDYMKLDRRALLASGMGVVLAAGMFNTEEVSRLVSALEEPRRVDAEVSRYLRRVLDEHKVNDYLVHPSDRVGMVVQQIGVLERLRRHATAGQVRDSLLQVQADYAEYLGWLFQELGNWRSAEYWTDRAVSYAHGAGDYQMVTFALGRKMNLANWDSRSQEAVDLGRHARQAAWPVPPGLASINAQHLARAHAQVGAEAAAQQMLQQAADLLDRRAASGEDRIFWARNHTTDFLQEQRARCYTDLGRIDEAIDILERLLLEEAIGGRSAAPLAVLSYAHARAGNIPTAAAAGEKALKLNMSACTLKMLHRSSDQLDRWQAEPSVRAFRSRLAELSEPGRRHRQST